MALDLDLDLDPCYDQLPPVAGGEAAAAKPLGVGLGGVGAPPQHEFCDLSPPGIKVGNVDSK